MAELLDLSPSRALDLNGLVAAGAKAYFYTSGTLTPITVYSDEGLTTPHPVPLAADASGFFAPVWANTGAIKAVIKTSDLGTTLATMDPVYRVSATTSAAANITFSPTAEIAQNNVQSALEDVGTKAISAAPNSFKGNNTGVEASVLDLTVAQAQSLLGFSNTLASTLNQVLPGGLIIKAGSVSLGSPGTGGDTSTSVTFAAAFPTAIVYVGLTTNDKYCPGTVVSPTTSGFSAQAHNFFGSTVSNLSGRWLAIGY